MHFIPDRRAASQRLLLRCTVACLRRAAALSRGDLRLRLAAARGGRVLRLAYRLEEPLELVAALLMNVPLAIKYGEARSGRG